MQKKKKSKLSCGRLAVKNRDYLIKRIFLKNANNENTKKQFFKNLSDIKTSHIMFCIVFYSYKNLKNFNEFISTLYLKKVKRIKYCAYSNLKCYLKCKVM